MRRTRPTGVLPVPRRARVRTGWWTLVFVFAIGCGDAQSAPGGAGATAGDSGAGGTAGTGTPASIASVTIDSEPALGTRLGERWALVATARDELGEPIADVSVQWSSSNVSVATVNDRGVVTALRHGTSSITATVEEFSDTVTVTARSAVPSDSGEMYTVWFARSDPANVAVVDGRLEVFALTPGARAPMTPWPHSGVAQIAYAGERMGMLTDVHDGVGTFRVLDPRAEWALLRVADVRAFQLLDDWIAQLDAAGALQIRQGLEGDWITVQESDVAEFLLHGDRIAVLQDDGALLAKDDLSDPWTTLATGVRSFVLHGDRIAVLLEEGDGTLQVQDGLGDDWVTLEVRVRQVALSGDRIGVLRKDGVARVKEGIDGPWVQLASSYVEAMQLEGDRIAIQFEGGDLRARDGIDGPWTILSTDSRRFALDGDSISMLTEDGELWFRSGLEGEWAETAPDGTVTEWLPVIRVPVPPARTVVDGFSGPLASCAGIDAWMCPTAYAESQQACLDDGARCKPVAEAASPLPAYGRFCGPGRPLEADWAWATGPDVGPIDAFDALCMHADYADAWYPSADPSTVEACIIRYGLTFGRTTRDGVALDPGTGAHAEVMAKLGNLGDVIANTEPYTTACDQDAFDAFIDAALGAP